MAETLGTLFRRHVGSWVLEDAPIPPPDELDRLAARADAAEALALATAARVEAEARRDMAVRIRGASHKRHATERTSRASARYQLARQRSDNCRDSAAAARQAECTALARWREAAHG